MAAGDRRVRVAREHPRELDDPRLALTTARLRPCDPRLGLLDESWWSAKAATWARWVTTKTWWLARARRAPPDRERRLAADAGVDLVEDQGRWCGGQHEAWASIARASSPPEATFASGRAGSPGFAPRRNSTAGRPVVPDAHLEAGAAKRQLVEVGLDGGAAGAALPRVRPRASSACLARSAAWPSSLSGPLASLRPPRARPGCAALRAEHHDVRKARAVLAPQLGEQLQPAPDRLEALRVLLDQLVF